MLHSRPGLVKQFKGLIRRTYRAIAIPFGDLNGGFKPMQRWGCSRFMNLVEYHPALNEVLATASSQVRRLHEQSCA